MHEPAVNPESPPGTMRSLLAGLLLIVVASGGISAQPADCPTEPSAGPMMPLSLDLAGRPGVPRGVTGQSAGEQRHQHDAGESGEQHLEAHDELGGRLRQPDGVAGTRRP